MNAGLNGRREAWAPALAIRLEMAGYDADVFQVPSKAKRRPRENAMDAVVETVADDVNRREVGDGPLEKRHEACIDLDSVQKRVEVTTSGGDKGHLRR